MLCERVGWCASREPDPPNESPLWPACGQGETAEYQAIIVRRSFAEYIVVIFLITVKLLSENTTLHNYGVSLFITAGLLLLLWEGGRGQARLVAPLLRRLLLRLRRTHPPLSTGIASAGSH